MFVIKGLKNVATPPTRPYSPLFSEGLLEYNVPFLHIPEVTSHSITVVKIFTIFHKI